MLGNQPFRLGLRTAGAMPWPRHPLAATPKHKGAGIARVMQDLQGPAVTKRGPDELALVRATPQTARELQLLRSKGFDDRRRGAGALVGLKEEGQGLLDALVRIQSDFVLRVVDQSHGQG